MAKTNYNQPLTPREIEVINNAEHYVTSMFMGKGQFYRTKVEKLTDAVHIAQTLAARYSKPCMLYAIMGARQALICNYYPDGSISIRETKK